MKLYTEKDFYNLGKLWATMEEVQIEVNNMAFVPDGVYNRIMYRPNYLNTLLKYTQQSLNYLANIKGTEISTKYATMINKILNELKIETIKDYPERLHRHKHESFFTLGYYHQQLREYRTWKVYIHPESYEDRIINQLIRGIDFGIDIDKDIDIYIE